MNRAVWTILNVVLLAAAAWTTHAILSPPPLPATTDDAGTAGVRAGKSGTKSPGSAPRARHENSGRTRAVLADIDTLWQRTLFNPQRTEEIASDGEPAPERTTEPYEFELLGIGIVGKRAAAIIWVHRSRRVPTVVRGRRVSPTRTTRSGTSKTPAAKRDRPRVYRLGDKVEDTGYVVKEILQDQVTLERGDEKKVLKLDRSDEGTTKRTEAAAREEEKRAQAHKARLAAASRNSRIPPKPGARAPKKVLAPPPPPPAPAPPPVGGTVRPPVTRSQAYVEDRIRRALEARKRIAERYRSVRPK